MLFSEIILYLLPTLAVLVASMHWRSIVKISISVSRSAYAYLHPFFRSIDAYLDSLDKSIDDHFDSLEAWFYEDIPILRSTFQSNCITEWVERDDIPEAESENESESESESESENANTDDEMEEISEVVRAGGV
ncbi:hypothetical protein BKA64DRAFT_725733 [Cadophora sp. MPI-SDFR-AT-0126]|nr:hypothetical protein BKA64DRAFT_725733 [Leotiomycetes sp. MPI-SDFR-AT-0126]